MISFFVYWHHVGWKHTYYVTLTFEFLWSLTFKQNINEIYNFCGHNIFLVMVSSIIFFHLPDADIFISLELPSIN